VRWSHYHLCQPADNSGLPMGGKDPSPVGLALAWVPSCRQYKAVTNNRFPLRQLASVAGCCPETAFREVTDEVPDKRRRLGTRNDGEAPGANPGGRPRSRTTTTL
jgi:hypothetical protein